jgi:hypothetical protein
VATPGEGEYQDSVPGPSGPPNSPLHLPAGSPTTITLADGEVLTQRIINGQPMWGQDSQSGWFSQDGTVFIPNSGPTAGVPQFGITDPGGQFLQNGAVRTFQGHQVYGTVQSDGSFLTADNTELQQPDGTWQKAMVTSDNTILTQRIINGQPMWGQDSQSGWFSQDGKVFIPNSNGPGGQVAGVPQFGITDPSGQFLQNGAVRNLLGQQVYGTVESDGSFLSEDGTQFQQQPGGPVEKSMLTSDGTILTQRTVNGQPMWGQDSKDGWFSQDGTVFDPNSNGPGGQVAGVPEFGITDPGGQFLENGAVRWFNGQQVYGTVLSDGSFLTEDNTELQQPDGTWQKAMVTSDGTILTQQIVNGQPMWGQDSKDGWFSQDGTVFDRKHSRGGRAGCELTM